MAIFKDLINNQRINVLVFFSPFIQQFDIEWDWIMNQLDIDLFSLYKIEVDKNLTLSEALRIKHSPTIIVYKDMEVVYRNSGFQSSVEILEKIKELK